MVSPIDNWENVRVWLIGASYGIGYELALALDQLNAKLALTARSVDQLSLLATQLKKTPLIIQADVRNYKQLEGGLGEILNAWGGIDVVIFGAGIYQPGTFEDTDLNTIEETIAINLLGATYAAKLVSPILKKQKYGTLALIGSVAGYRGLPNANAYGPSKAALISLSETLFQELKPHNVDVRLISPGFVATRLTDKNKFEMPMKITASQAAQAIIQGFKKRSFQIDFPKSFSIPLRLLRIIPYSLYFWLMGKLISNDRK